MVRQRRQRVHRRRHAQGGKAPAQNQLLGLRKELDLANAAPAQFDIVACHRDLAMAAMGMDLPLDGVNILDRREIQIAPPDERLDRFQKGGAGLRIAGAGPRLDHGGAFPILPLAFVIGFRRFGGDRHLGRARVRPEPQIDAKDIALHPWVRRSAASAGARYPPPRRADRRAWRREISRHRKTPPDRYRWNN